MSLMAYGQTSGVPSPAPDSKAILHHRKAYAGSASSPSSVALARNLPLSFEISILITALGRYAVSSQSTGNAKAIFQQPTFCL